MTAERRRRAFLAGRRAETLALWFLRCKGYRLVQRGYKTPMGEIDLIVKRGRTLVFVEVKRRDDLAMAVLAVTPQQRRRIAAAAESFLGRMSDRQRFDVRFDIVAVGAGMPKHIQDAWRPGF